jgi:tRNA pseudouridine55 synthase
MEHNGLLLIDKTPDCTSHDVVAQVRRILGQKSVGHCGTLDPMASGLLVILLGQATKLSNYILTADKRYRVRIQFGRVTDSGDRTGETVLERPVIHSEADLERAIKGLTGHLQLPVPIFSAVKVGGRKLYEFAREQEKIEVPVKSMRFYDVRRLESGPDWQDVEVSCAKGGFIRSWVPAIGEALGCGATVGELRRIQSEPHDVKDAITIDTLRERITAPQLPLPELGKSFIPMAQALPNWRQCAVKGREEQLLRNGQISRDLTNRLILAQKDAHLSQGPIGIKILGSEGDLVGLIEALPLQGLKIRRIFARQES